MPLHSTSHTSPRVNALTVSANAAKPAGTCSPLASVVATTSVATTERSTVPTSLVAMSLDGVVPVTSGVDRVEVELLDPQDARSAAPSPNAPERNTARRSKSEPMCG